MGHFWGMANNGLEGRKKIYPNINLFLIITTKLHSQVNQTFLNSYYFDSGSSPHTAFSNGTFASEKAKFLKVSPKGMLFPFFGVNNLYLGNEKNFRKRGNKVSNS